MDWTHSSDKVWKSIYVYNLIVISNTLEKKKTTPLQIEEKEIIFRFLV